MFPPYIIICVSVRAVFRNTSVTSNIYSFNIGVITLVIYLNVFFISFSCLLLGDSALSGI